MNRSSLLVLGLLPVLVPASVSSAEPAPAPEASVESARPEPPASIATGAPALPEDSAAAALRRMITALPTDGTDEERREYTAVSAFYAARGDAPLWFANGGSTAGATAATAEIKNAGAWGLEAGDFPVPDSGAAAHRDPGLAPEALAAGELKITLAVLKYARYARGGRIIHPAGDLNSHLDRRPQFIDPRTALDEIAAAEDTAAYLRQLHPQHPQFERLRQKYLAATAQGKAADAKKFLANMEQWRWMWRDMGDLYVVANVPEFMLHVVKNGEVIHSERIVAGETGKQTSIFSRTLKHIVLRPKWRVPASIKAREIYPSLLRGGNMMAKYGLQLETKDGQPLDYRSVDWRKADIREYEVTQPPGRGSALGLVKFSFPSQHTIYMHDTPDKYMFNAAQRTLTHGCLRVRNPMKLAEILLNEDKGWDRARIDELSKSGPLNNEVAIERKIPIHITYFTAWVADDGSVRSFRDVYGHEQRIKLALDKKWDKIAKGRDHLAPVELLRSEPARVSRAKPREESTGDLIGAALRGGF